MTPSSLNLTTFALRVRTRPSIWFVEGLATRVAFSVTFFKVSRTGMEGSLDRGETSYKRGRLHPGSKFGCLPAERAILLNVVRSQSQVSASVLKLLRQPDPQRHRSSSVRGRQSA